MSDCELNLMMRSDGWTELLPLLLFLFLFTQILCAVKINMKLPNRCFALHSFFCVLVRPAVIEPITKVTANIIIPEAYPSRRLGKTTNKGSALLASISLTARLSVCLSVLPADCRQQAVLLAANPPGCVGVQVPPPQESRYR